MNTNIETTLTNILAPLNGDKSDTKGTNTALFDPKNSEFSEIVRKMQAAHENGLSSDTPDDGGKKPLESILGQQISAKLSELIANKGQKTENLDTSDVEAALLEIAALIEAHPEQIENLENLQFNHGITPEVIENMPEIKDFLASFQQTTAVGPGAVQTPATGAVETVTMPVTPEAAATETAPVPTADVVTVPEQAQQMAAVPAGPVENSKIALPKSSETSTQAPEQVFSQLNAAATQSAEPNTQQQSNGDSNAGNAIARQVAQAVINQQQADAAAAEAVPPRQIGPMTDQILNSATDKADRPLAGDVLQDISNTAEVIADEPIGSNSIDSTGPTTEVSVLGKTDGPSTSNADIARQVQETIISSSRAGDKQVVIRLDPPELGQVTMRFIEKPEGITGILHVEQPQTRQEIERALPEIIQNLQNASVQVKKVEVVQTPQQQFDNSRNESAFSGQQSGFQEQDEAGSQPHQAGYVEGGNSFENPAEPQAPEMQSTDKSINMLI